MIEIAPRITADLAIRFGKPVIRDTRMPVALILAKLAGGMSVEELAVEYELSTEDVHAAPHYAAMLVADAEILLAAQWVAS